MIVKQLPQPYLGGSLFTCPPGKRGQCEEILQGWSRGKPFSYSHIEQYLYLARGATKKHLIRAGSAPRSDPFLLHTIFGRKDTPFVYLTLTNGIPFVYLPLDYNTPFTYKLKLYSHKVCVRNILMKGPFKYLNDRFPYPFIYLKRERGTPFGRSFAV